MSTKFKLIISVILLGVLIFIVSKAIKVGDLLEIILNFPKEKLVLFFALSFVITLLKAWRFLILLRNSNINISFLETSKVFIASQAITPLPGGEAMRGILVHKESGVEPVKTSGPVLTQAFLEMFSAAIMAVVLSIALKNDFIIPSLVGFFILCLVFIFIVYRRILDFVFTRLPENKFISKLSKKVFQIQKEFRKSAIDEDTKLPDKVLVRALGLSLIINVFGGFLIFLIAQSYSADLNIFRSTLTYSAGIVIQSLASISPGGIGFTEGGMTGILLLSDIELAKALGIVLLFRIVTLIFNVFLGLIFLAIFYGNDLMLSKKVTSK
jgi:uncharacterized protein (TIRG00374 family)